MKNKDREFVVLMKTQKYTCIIGFLLRYRGPNYAILNNAYQHMLLDMQNLARIDVLGLFVSALLFENDLLLHQSKMTHRTNCYGR